jgi:cell wall-associated NlpC family hydrolase
MGSVSGVTRDQRIRARDRVIQAALLAHHHAREVHYTTGVRRWQGIDEKRNARLGMYPTEADCSSFATWCLWNGLFLGFGLGDNVNGAHWRAGYTGTMLDHGKQVRAVTNVQRGDLVLYGSGPPCEHVTVVISIKGRVPMVISHGSEAGPFYLEYDYRSDIYQIRRYI